MRSSAEQEIRDVAVAKLRGMFPSARIVHELNVAGQGSNRIDVAAISGQSIVGVEIKSERDTLKRLDEQWAAFNKCCHFVFVAAHDKHFAEHRSNEWRDDVPSEWHLNHPIFFGKWGMEKHVWRWPSPVESRSGGWGVFNRHRDTQVQPKASDMLFMLWAEELRAESSRHGLPSSARIARPDLIVSMVWHMTGREICEAVCRQLRMRQFAEADAPEMAVAA